MAKRWSKFRARKRPRASGPFPNSSPPAVTREAEEDWGKKRRARKDKDEAYP
jgi:hypothetical protein